MKDVGRTSFSKLKCYEDCPYAYYLGYHLDDDDRENFGYIKEGNYYAENGSLVHSILERYFKGEISIDDMPEIYLEEYDDICYKVSQSTMDKTFEACMEYFTEEDFSWLDGWEIVGVELKVEMEVRGYHWIGFIDLLLKNKETGELWIVDHKSSDYPFKRDGTVAAKSKEHFESYKIQMYLYANAVKKLYGKYPTLISWNHFKKNKRATIPFVESEYKKAMTWFIRTVHKIEKEEKFEPKKSYIHCGQLCDFRNCCEYRKEDEE